MYWTLHIMYCTVLNNTYTVLYCTELYIYCTVLYWTLHIPYCTVLNIKYTVLYYTEHYIYCTVLCFSVHILITQMVNNLNVTITIYSKINVLAFSLKMFALYILFPLSLNSFTFAFTKFNYELKQFIFRFHFRVLRN